ncbi:hypothetical protein Lsan_1835 [Legionella santicrucis]|uniref:Uncharacterized protein n=1 Tax=Legionella santicrucis TaxID=45074 RepID=A0A0W0YX74_9GAMM|nr:hypothetical protein [Legionella santicrucis]KTD61458.1 hypothetical protein Lsan_1835 [Legionella santicrucis]
MGKINQEIHKYIATLANQGIQVEFCLGLKPQQQSGQVCKLIAGAVVQEYLVNQKFHSQTSLPLQKKGIFSYSLRQHAKQVIHSQVGEVYGPTQMKKVFDYNKFETTSFHITNKDSYEKFIIHMINQKQPVIAYFDVTPRMDLEEQGMPGIFNGSFEHGAAIAGYYYSNAQLNLIIAQWGEFYEIAFDALFNSTSQLSTVKSPENYQKYYPIPGLFSKKTWLEKKQMDIICDSLCEKQTTLSSIVSFLNYMWPKDQERIAIPPNDDSACLANVLTLITGNSHTIELGDFYQYRLDFEKLNEEQNEYDFSPRFLICD